MATVLTTIVPAEPASDSSPQRCHGAVYSDTPLFRFRLRQLFAFVAAICAILTATASVSGLTCLALLLVAAVIFMHVFATALSRSLQARTESQRRHQALFPATNGELPTSLDGHVTHTQVVRSATRSPWHGRGCTYLPWLRRLVVGAMVLGAIADLPGIADAERGPGTELDLEPGL